MRRLRPALLAAGLLAASVAASAREARAQDGLLGGDPAPRAPADRDDPRDDPRSDSARDAAEARAAADAAHVAQAKGVKLAFRLGVRFLDTAPFSKVYEHVLDAYGYGSMSALVEGAADVGLSPSRWIDLGLHTGYAFGSAGTSGGSGGLLTFHELEVGGYALVVFGRSDPRRAGTLGAGVEGGGMFPFLLLRGDVSHASVPYVAPVFVARLIGDARIQTTVQARYVVANWSNAFGTVGMPLGGLSISVGANLSL
jgi:hypothetical protein